MKVLHLTLKKEPFEVMITGEKSFEIREKSEWMECRLFNKDGSEKHYDVIKFTNGYGKNRPYFIAEYKGFETVYCVQRVFSNGFRMELDGEFWCIKLGQVLSGGNLKT